VGALPYADRVPATAEAARMSRSTWAKFRSIVARSIPQHSRIDPVAPLRPPSGSVLPSHSQHRISEVARTSWRGGRHHAAEQRLARLHGQVGPLLPPIWRHDTVAAGIPRRRRQGPLARANEPSGRKEVTSAERARGKTMLKLSHGSERRPTTASNRRPARRKGRAGRRIARQRGFRGQDRLGWGRTRLRPRRPS
jgi:hypothetical protein